MSTLEFNRLIELNLQNLQLGAYYFTRNKPDAEDLLQDTVLRALKYKTGFVDGTNFKGWLFTIMRNIFINDFKRKKLKRLLMDQQDNKFSVHNFQSNEVSDIVNAKDILSLISSLEFDFRKPFEMYVGGFHYDEIAREMCIPLGTVKSRIFNTRKKMMQVLQVV